MSIEQDPPQYNTENLAIPPAALDRSYVGRVEDGVKARERRTLWPNAGKIGLLAAMDGYIPDISVKDAPWDGFISATSGIETSEAIVRYEDDDPKRAITGVDATINLSNPEKRKTLQNLATDVQAGTSIPKAARFENDESGSALLMENGRYELVAAMGRFATLCFFKQHKGILPPQTMRLVDGATVGEIRADRAERFLPRNIRKQMDELEDDMLLTSGKFGIVGRSFRNVLPPDAITLQLPRKDRPYLEKGVDLRHAKLGTSGIPVSSTTMRSTLTRGAVEAMDEFTEPYKERDLAKISKDLIGLAGDDGPIIAAGLAIKSAALLGAAHGSAIKGEVVDWSRRRRPRQLKAGYK